jgi:hypothetical protein
MHKTMKQNHHKRTHRTPLHTGGGLGNDLDQTDKGLGQLDHAILYQRYSFLI